MSYSGWGHAGNFRGYLRAASGELLFSGSGRWQTLDLDFPAFFDGDAVGASSTGIVRFLREQGARQVLVAPEQVTPASRQVDPTIAQDVAYVGDLAVDLSVEPGVPALLWRLAAEDLDSSLFPAAHRRALYRATDGALVMLAPAQEVPEAPTGS